MPVSKRAVEWVLRVVAVGAIVAVTAIVSCAGLPFAPEDDVPTVAEVVALLNESVTTQPEDRCSPYSRGDYGYPAWIEADIIASQTGTIYGPFTGSHFHSVSETDIEHIVATSEAHDSGACAWPEDSRDAFARDVLNLTLASPQVNRNLKSDRDFAEWQPPRNACWTAGVVVRVKAKWNLSVDEAERAALASTLADCGSVGMVVYPADG